MATTIQDLPAEVMVLIFKYLKFTDIGENCAKTCLKWEAYAAQFFIGPHILRLSKYNLHLVNYLLKEGWTEDYNSTELIMKLYEKFVRLPKATSKVLVAGGSGGIDADRDIPAEIFDFSNPNIVKTTAIQNVSCRLFPSGGFFQDKVIICGGTANDISLEDIRFIKAGKRTIDTLPGIKCDDCEMYTTAMWCDHCGIEPIHGFSYRVSNIEMCLLKLLL